MSLEMEIELPDTLELDQDQDMMPPEEKMQYHGGIKKYIHIIVDAWFATPARIAATCALVLACFGLILWNLDRLSILDELVELEVSEYRLDSQLNDLELELASIDVESLSTAIEAENDKVFQGWQRSLQIGQWCSVIRRRSHIYLPCPMCLKYLLL